MPPSFTPHDYPRSDSFADLMTSLLILARGKLMSGAPYWAYMAIQPSMARAFTEARQSGAFDLEEFGTILEWGEGNDPPPDIVERMKRDYGMQPDFEDKLKGLVKKLS